MRRVLVLAAAAVAPIAVAGCDRADTVRVHGRVAAIRVADYRYEPQSLSIRRGRITFAITNAGSEPTNFRVRRRRRPLANLATLQPGASATVTVDLKPGTYTMYSSVARNESLGEYGTLTVR